MSRMKHLLRKFHIGGGGGSAAGSSGGHRDPVQSHPHHGRVAGPPGNHRPRRPAPAAAISSSLAVAPSGASASSSSTSPSSSSRGKSLETSSSEVGGGSVALSQGVRGGEDEQGFSFFEEEYQVQLALAISVSDPDGREDPESAQMEAAKRMSLACNTVVPTVVAGGAGREDAFEEVLSLRYWKYNSVNYDEKIAEGFYDVYGIVSNLNLLGKMPSLVELQAISVLDNVDYEVVSVNRAIDHTLRRLERRAVSIALECKAAEPDPTRNGLVQKLSDLVVDSMGGPVCDVNAMIKRWRRKNCELRTSLSSIVLPLGCLEVGLARHRALLFKVLADKIDLPCRLMKGSYYTGTDDGAIDLIKADDGSEYIIDLMGAPGTLIPAEIPSCYLQNSGLDVINKDVAQTVKDFCLAIDKKINCQFEKTPEASGSPDPPLDIIGPLAQEENVAGLHSRGRDAGDSDANNSATSGDGSWTLLSLSSGSQLDTCINHDATSPSHQKKVNDVSKYVVTAAKNPEFAQKLHAVLLESGASPPPDLFQNIISALDVGQQKDLLGPAETMMGKQNLISGSNSSSKSSHQDIFEGPETEGHNHVKNCEKTSEDKFRLITNSDSSGISNGRLNEILNDVADWEISWEDVQIGERIGLGSYGEVYRADWHGTEVAVKKFLDQDVSGDALEQFRCEVKIMLRLRHPNVVLFMGAVTCPPNLSILTEFLPRGSLYKLLHRTHTQLDERRRLRMAMDVAKGMNYLHTSHPTIVHRDLKSPNLLVDKNWVVKVCDFGLSRLQHHTFLSSKSTAGTPEWMAPEVLRNEPANEKCDVYSFGVILWELATLCMPWSGMNPMQVVGAVGFQNKRLKIPKEVDPVVAQIICDCWHSDPRCRPPFSQLMVRLKHLQRLIVDS